jgi:putative peptide zinc metalloprotease protein
MLVQAAPEENASSAPISSSQRPIPLQGRTDLVAESMDFQGARWWVLKDPIGLQYHRLQAQQYSVLKLLDGQRSLKEIRDELAKEFPAVPLQLIDVQRMITSLFTEGLVWSRRPGQAGQIVSRQHQAAMKKLRQSLGNVLSIRLPGWDPDRTLTWMNKNLGWIFHPVTGLAALVLVAATWTLLLVQFQEFQNRLPEFQQFFGWQNLVWLWLTLAATKIIHEFGHGLSCKHFGGECHEMGVMLLVFSPTLYCDVTDSWMMPNKWHRIWIAAAGMIIEIVLSALAILVWWFTTPGLLNHLCLNIFFVTTITTVIFNANPLMRYDGYYMLSDWLGIPNLRSKATQALRSSFSSFCLGITTPPDPLMPPRGRGWFIVYALATTVYGWFVLSAVLIFLYFVLKPYGLQSIGIALAAVSLFGIVSNLVVTLIKILMAPRSEPMSRFRAISTVVVIAAAVCAAMMIPLPWYIEAPFLIEPHDAVQVMTSVAGELVSFDVRPGQFVQQGDLLATLRDPEKEDQLNLLQAGRESQLAEIAMLHALEHDGEHAIALKQLQTIDRRIADLKQQLEQLTIIAPISGKVIEAPRIPEPPQSQRRRLNEWSGQISNPAHLGCLVPVRTHLLSIAPSDRMEAVLYLDQAHRDDLTVDQQIEIKFDHLADRTDRAIVLEIAREHSDVAPPSLSSKLGGSLTSTTDAAGRERLTSVAYQARVIIDDETFLLKPGMRGNARFLVDRRSAAQWIWRAFRRTMHFRL